MVMARLLGYFTNKEVLFGSSRREDLARTGSTSRGKPASGWNGVTEYLSVSGTDISLQPGSPGSHCPSHLENPPDSQMAWSSFPSWRHHTTSRKMIKSTRTNSTGAGKQKTAEVHLFSASQATDSLVP